MYVSQELELPRAQNFIRLKPLHFMSSNQTIDIGTLNEEQANLYGDLIKKSFMENWKKRKENLEKS